MQMLWHHKEPSLDFFRTVRVSWYVVVGMGQYDGSLEASELALCPACTDRGLMLWNQTFMLLRLPVSDGSTVGTAKTGLSLWTLLLSVCSGSFARKGIGFCSWDLLFAVAWIKAGGGDCSCAVSRVSHMCWRVIRVCNRLLFSLT